MIGQSADSSGYRHAVAGMNLTAGNVKNNAPDSQSAQPPQPHISVSCQSTTHSQTPWPCDPGPATLGRWDFD